MNVSRDRFLSLFQSINYIYKFPFLLQRPIILNIKIISYEKLKKINFGAVIIFAWNFAESIIMRIKKDYKNKKIIIPFPKVKVIKS